LGNNERYTRWDHGFKKAMHVKAQQQQIMTLQDSERASK